MKAFIFRDTQSVTGCSYVVKASWEEAQQELVKACFPRDWRGRFALYMTLEIDMEKLFEKKGG